jgi:hypothetical protein
MSCEAGESHSRNLIRGLISFAPLSEEDVQISPRTGDWEGVVGHSESAGINRHVAGDERALRERRKRLHPDPESCRCRREARLEA